MTIGRKITVKTGSIEPRGGYQRSLGRLRISLMTIACRTPPGLASIAAICAAGDSLAWAVDGAGSEPRLAANVPME